MKRYRKIFVVSVSNVTTGGPENLHQLVDQLRTFGHDASIVYFPDPNAPIPAAYGKYNVQKATEIEDSDDCAVVMPEYFAEKVFNYHHATVFLWWLSYDYYFGDLRKPFWTYFFRRKRMKLLERIRQSNVVNVFQSVYAQKALAKHGLSGEMLSDYINPAFHEFGEQARGAPRKPVILYNPTKGVAFNRAMRRNIRTATCVPLRKLTRDQVRTLMTTSAMYVDLGEHPGKDRMPREAAACGALVIAARRGSAAEPEDMPIDDEFKITLDRKTFVRDLTAMVDRITQSTDLYRKQDGYRAWIAGERDRFAGHVKALFGDRREASNV